MYVGCQRDVARICCGTVAAERRRLLYGARSAAAAVDRYFLPAVRSAENPPHAAAIVSQRDGQTDRLTLDCYVDPVSVNNAVNVATITG